MLEQQDAVLRVIELQEEVAQLKRAVVSHAVIDQAIGVVTAYAGLRPDAAWDVLKEVSQNTNTKLREVAEHVVQWPHSTWLPPGIHRALTVALDRAQHGSTPQGPPRTVPRRPRGGLRGMSRVRAVPDVGRPPGALR